MRKKRCVQCFGRETSLEMATWSNEEVVYINVTETCLFTLGGRLNCFGVSVMESFHLVVATSCRLVCSVNMAHSADCQHALLGIHSHIRIHFTYVFKAVGSVKISGCQSNETLPNPV